MPSDSDRKPLDYSLGKGELPRPILSGRIAALIWIGGLVMIGAATALVPFVSAMLREFKGEMPGFTRIVFTIYNEWIGTSVLFTSLIAIGVLPFALTRLIWSGNATSEDARRRERVICALLYLLLGLGAVIVIVAVVLPYVSVMNSLSR